MAQSREISRRRFVSNSILAAWAATWPRESRLFAQAASAAASSQDVVIGSAIQPRVTPFPMTDVRLRSGPFLTAMEIDRAYLHSLPNDRLLHMFRVTAGLPTTAQPLGGWEAPDCELRGHFSGGHYLSACALMYASTGDEALKQKANALVAELAKCQAEDGYLSAFPTEFFGRLRDGKKVWAPFYTYHKIMAGHFEMYRHCGNLQALATAEKMARWADSYVQPIPEAQWRQMQKVEYGGMSEVLYNLYGATRNPKYMTLAKHFEQKSFFDPLAASQDALAGLHANTNIPKVIGAARGYELTGEARYQTIADYFWQEVVSRRTYATGGTSNREHWQALGELPNQLGADAEECCTSYNMLKLTRHLYTWSADPRLMDYYERLLFNVRLGTQDKDGMLMYYVSLHPGLWKTFGTPTDSFWCCTGTGVEEYAKTNNAIYFHDAGSLYVNLFHASEVQWRERSLRVVQETNFPEQEGTAFTVHTPAAQSFALCVRVPYWATQGVAVRINGQPISVAAAPSTYLSVDRQWRDGDRVEVDLPMHLHAAPFASRPTLQAAMYGPLVLAAVMAPTGVPRELQYGPLGPDAKKLPPLPMPTAHSKTGSIASSIAVERSAGEGSPWTFRTVGQPVNTQLIPLYRISNERYSVYWNVESV